MGEGRHIFLNDDIKGKLALAYVDGLAESALILEYEFLLREIVAESSD